MKSALLTCFTVAVALLSTSCDKNADAGKSSGTAPSGEAAFVSAYRKALESSDTKTLDSFLMDDGAPAEIVGFFKMMREVPPGATVVDVTLETPNEAEAAKFNSVMPMPDGKPCRLPIVPTKKLVITMKSKDGTGESTSTLPVAEKDGKLIIPLPVPAA